MRFFFASLKFVSESNSNDCKRSFTSRNHLLFKVPNKHQGKEKGSKGSKEEKGSKGSKEEKERKKMRRCVTVRNRCLRVSGPSLELIGMSSKRYNLNTGETKSFQFIIEFKNVEKNFSCSIINKKFSGENSKFSR